MSSTPSRSIQPLTCSGPSRRRPRRCTARQRQRRAGDLLERRRALHVHARAGRARSRAAPARPPAPAWTATRRSRRSCPAAAAGPRRPRCPAAPRRRRGTPCRAAPVQRLVHPLLQRHRVQVVDQHAGCPPRRRRPAARGRRRSSGLEHPPAGPRRASRARRPPAPRPTAPGLRVGDPLELVGELLIALESSSSPAMPADRAPTPAPVGRVHHLPHLALAVYMCTPQGRHGSKLAHGAHDVHALEASPVRSPRRSACSAPRPRRAPACRTCHAGWRSTASAGRAGSWRSCRP